MTFEQFEKKYIANVVKGCKKEFKKYRKRIGSLDLIICCEYCPFTNQCDEYEYPCSEYLTDHIDEVEV